MTIVDYGLGNVLAFANIYKGLNIDATIARGPSELRRASKIILPGVGAYDHAMERLEQSTMRPVLNELVQEKRVPVLGICVGMQILGRSSDEGKLPGLGWLAGEVRGFKSQGGFSLPVPHIGWNDVEVAPGGSRLFTEIEANARFYFLHSFFFDCDDTADVAAVSTYGVRFSCAVHRNNVYGVQFHPEKSHQYGTQLLKNFAAL
jgi:imidazole glycerol-phosphate synthase subunit HisH